MIHRYLANFFNNLDSKETPLHDAINTDYYNLLPNEEPLDEDSVHIDSTKEGQAQSDSDDSLPDGAAEKKA